MNKFAVGLFLIVILSISKTEARVFDFKSERFAAYFGGSYGLSRVNDSPYGGSSGPNTTFNKSISSSASGEIGFVIAGQNANFKIGAEMLIPQHYTDIKGSVSGTEMFNLDSSVTALIPTATVEFQAYRSATSRMLISVGYGLGFVTLENKYTFTPSGVTAFPGVGDHTESASAKVSSVQTSIGYEFLFTDTITAFFRVGYRHMPVGSLKSSRSVQSFTGSYAEGDELQNQNGGSRSIDLSGGYAALNFRFYIGL
jgi:hypothetical protein